MCNLEQKLEELLKAKHQLFNIEAEKEVLLKHLLGDEVYSVYKKHMDKYAVLETVKKSEIEAREADIKQAVIDSQQTVAVEGATVKFNKARITWDTKLLEFIADSTPEVLKCKKVGSPYASITYKPVTY